MTRNVIGSDDFFNLITVGRLLNAATYARNNGAVHQLAKFSKDKDTVYLTAGLLYNAMALSGVMAHIYKGKPFVNDFKNLIETGRYYYLPKVLFDMRFNGPFHIHSNNIVINEYIKDLNLTGQTIMLPQVKNGQRSFPIATIADTSETMDEVKRSGETDVHQNLTSVIECLLDEFTLAAEEFIFTLSRQIGLKTVEQKRIAV